MESVNPATGKRIRKYQEHSSRDIDRMLKVADKAFRSWRTTSWEARRGLLLKASGLLIKHKDRYARLMAEEMGKPVTQGAGEVEKCAGVCAYYARHAKGHLQARIIPTEASKSFVIFEPLGVVLAVMPWNFPFWQVFRCLAPALMAGNAVALKHASNVCGCALAIERLMREAGFPKGLFSALLVSSPKVGNIIENPYIKAVSLTGGTQAGRSIAAIAGGMIKKTVLELGGSDPYLVLKDADLDLAVEKCVLSRLINAGQSCIAAKRFIVAEAVFEVFTEKFVERMGRQRMGDPMDKDVSVGPMARHELRDQLHSDVQKSLKRGAKLLLGGAIPDGPGAFYPPTVLTNVKPGMPAYEKELFGPVAVIMKAPNEKEAVRMANDSVFGLGSAIFSKNVKRAQKLASRIDAGNCFVNDYVRSDPRLPFGGIKDSGYGRELSDFGIKEFVNIKTIYVR